MIPNDPQNPNAQGPSPVDPSTGYQNVPNYGPAYDQTAPAGQPGYPPPPAPGTPNPVAAGLLGLIPGVGAMYNGQYAKGIVHLIVFAVLVSLADQNGIFGMFVAGWIFYQAIEAHHTAKARRDGQPLPNPFNLNDIGERFGFGKSWPGSFSAPFNQPQPGQPYPPQPPYTQTPPAQPGSPAWNAQQQAYAPPAAQYTTPYGAPPAPGQTTGPIPGPTPYGMGGDPNWGAPADSYAGNPYAAPVPVAPVSRLPMGAIVLIGLGVLFLLGNEGIFHGIFHIYLVPIILIAAGCGFFYRKLTLGGGASAENDGTVAYNYRLLQALRSSCWIVLTGVLWLLDSTDVLGWNRSWPLYIILFGVLTVFQRQVLRQTFGTGPYTPPYGGVPPTGQPNPYTSGPIVTPPPTTTAVVPLDPITDRPMTDDQEGR